MTTFNESKVINILNKDGAVNYYRKILSSEKANQYHTAIMINGTKGQQKLQLKREVGVNIGKWTHVKKQFSHIRETLLDGVVSDFNQN